MAPGKVKERVADIVQQRVRLLNATVGKPYETSFNFDTLNWKDITAFEFDGLEETGLKYDEKTRQITGVPTQSGDRKITFSFKVDGEPENAPFNKKRYR